MTPLSAIVLPPRIVCVLPVPVTPYAKSVTSNPAKRCFIVGDTVEHELSQTLKQSAVNETDPRFQRCPAGSPPGRKRY